MPLDLKDDAPTKFPNPEFLTLENFKRGVITLIDKSRLPKDALQDATNIFLYEDGQPGPRPGVGFFGTAPSANAIDGFDYFDFNGVTHLVVVAGGTVYRSTDDGATWSTCTGATLTAGVTVNMNQYNSDLYLTNGVDNITLYDGSTTIVTYTALTTPAAASIVRTGLASSNFTYYYKISAVNTIGFSAASASVSQAVSLTRDGWDATTNYLTLTLPALQGTQTRYDIYISEDNLTYYYLDSTTSTTYKDDGSAIVTPSTVAPTGNTTQGPKVEELSNVGSRMFGVRDTADRYKIWFTSGQAPFGSFSNAYDGGYLRFRPGGKEIPVKVIDYRDGKGTPLATVFCKSSDGQGTVLQMTLDTLTVGDLSVIIPSAYQLPGSRGTSAPLSVVNVLNDYMFYNQQAFYNLGSRAQFLNLLSTDETSVNIRPTIQQISVSAESKICALYFNARVYFSVPYGSTSNNYTAIYDTERKAWLPKAFNIGFSKFIHYTDTAGGRRLLALRPGDTKLSEINSNIQGDYGVAFETVLTTGLYPTTKDRFEFQFTEEAEIELSNAEEDITISLVGYERSSGLTNIKTEVINAGSSTSANVGWDTFFWETTNWENTSIVVSVISESSLKRYFTVQKELNAAQWQITTTALGARYILRTLQTWGTPTLAGKPRQWRLTG